MLTAARRWAPLARLVPAVLLLGFALVATGGAAQAACTPGDKPIFDRETKTLIYPCERGGNRGPGKGGHEGTNVGTKAPSCNLTPPATFCRGTAACYIKDSVVPFLPPKSEPPKPDAQWVVRICINTDGSGGGEAIWLTDDLPVEPPLIVQAQEAVGELRLPKLGMKTNPRGRSIVNLETRFRPTGPVDEPVEGTSAFGLVAIATLETWYVETGEGEVSCRLPRACVHTYRRGSAGQADRDAAGLPAYGVRSYGVWAIAYEVDGDPVTIPGAQTTIDGPVTTLPLAVAEIQSVVTGGG